MKPQILYYSLLPHFSEIWSKAEKSNDAKAQFELAELYSATKKSSVASRAFELYKKAADQKYTTVQTEALFEVGKCYENGFGIRQSYLQAILWYEKAVINITCCDLVKNPDPVGDAATAQILSLSVTGQLDKMIRINEDLIKLKREAAERGDIKAQNFLTELYYFGGEVEQSYEKSAYWAMQAADSGYADAQNHLGHLYYYGQGVEQNYELSVYWSMKAAEQGSEAAMHRLGEFYKSQRHYKEAAKWYRKYAEQRIKWRNQRLGW